MDNMQKAFKRKSALRKFADGGIFRSEVDGVPTFSDKRSAGVGAIPYAPKGGTFSVMGSEPAPVAAPPTLRMPTQAMADPVAAAGRPPTPTPAPVPTSSPKSPTGLRPLGNDTETVRRNLDRFSTFERMAGRSGYYADGGKVEKDHPKPTPEMLGDGAAAAVGRRLRDRGRDLDAQLDAMVDPKGKKPERMASGGEVDGPGGPVDDKVPAMLSDGEYVLPADTVDAVGTDTLDALRYATHDFDQTKGSKQGLRPKMADGGFMDVFKRPKNPVSVRYTDPNTGEQQILGVTEDGPDRTPTLKDTFKAAISGGDVGAPKPAPLRVEAPAAPPAAAPVDTQAAVRDLDRQQGNLRTGQLPSKESGFAVRPEYSTADSVVMGRKNPNAGQPDQSAEQFIGVGKPAPPEDPLLKEVRAGLRSRPSVQLPRQPSSGASAINERYDQLAKDARSAFTSDLGKGNLTRRLLQIEQARNSALGEDARNRTGLRGQDINAANAAAQLEETARANALDTLVSLRQQDNAASSARSSAAAKLQQEAAKAEEAVRENQEKANTAIASTVETRYKDNPELGQRVYSLIQAAGKEKIADIHNAEPGVRAAMIEDLVTMAEQQIRIDNGQGFFGTQSAGDLDQIAEQRPVSLFADAWAGMDPYDALQAKTKGLFGLDDTVYVTDSGRPVQASEVRRGLRDDRVIRDQIAGAAARREARERNR